MGSATTNFYDSRGLLMAVSNVFGLVVTNSYDATTGLLVSSTDAVGAVTTNQYDSLGNLTYTQTGYYSNNTFVAMISTGYGYDADGNRVAMTNGLNVVTTYGYDAQKRIVAVTNAYGTSDQTVSQTIYDLADRVAQEIDPRGTSNAFGYDALGRRTSITNALGTASQQVITFARHR